MLFGGWHAPDNKKFYYEGVFKMPFKIIGKSILGDLGLSQNVEVMRDKFDEQLLKVRSSLPSQFKDFRYTLAMTSMTGFAERKVTKGEYFPKIRRFTSDLYPFVMPKLIYKACANDTDKLRPGCDFLIWDSNKFKKFVATTFSREAPILAFESTSGQKCLGVILRPSLMKYGDYLFSTIKDELRGNITVTLVTCNHFNYPEGSIPTIIQNLADNYDMNCIIGDDSEKNPECYHRGEKGNHVVAMW